MAMAKRPRTLLAVALASIVIFFLTFQSRDVITEKIGRPDVFKSGKSDKTELPPNVHAQPTLATDAHKFPTADSYIQSGHFKAVTRIKGITIQEAKKTCTWPHLDEVDFQYEKDVDWVVKDRNNSEIEERRALWHKYIENDFIPYYKVKDKFKGRGLVIVAGNHDTLMRVRVILRQLNKLESDIAIELHYWDDEMSEETRKELEAMYKNLHFNDLSDKSPEGQNIIHIRKDGPFINFQLKTASLINSRFAEPLLLDSDNVPVIDPSTLYDSPTYKEYGTVFWPDIARSWPQNPAWAITNTPCRMDEWEQESGQLMVDKRRYWYHLQLASWLNNEQGTYYNQFLLGDKDMFRFAWHALRTDYGKPKKWLTSVGNENDGYYCGHSFAQHEPDGDRVAFLHGGLMKSTALEVMKWNKEEKGGYFRHYKRADTDEDPSVNVKVGIKFDGADYKPNHTDKFKVAMCTDMFDVKVRDVNEILPGWEKHFEEIGGFWQLEQVEKEEKQAKEKKN